MAIVGIDNPASATAADIAALPADAFAGATADDLAAMPPTAMEGMGPDMMAAMPPDAMGGMDADMMAAMPPTAMEGRLVRLRGVTGGLPKTTAARGGGCCKESKCSTSLTDMLNSGDDGPQRSAGLQNHRPLGGTAAPPSTTVNNAGGVVRGTHWTIVGSTSQPRSSERCSAHSAGLRRSGVQNCDGQTSTSKLTNHARMRQFQTTITVWHEAGHWRTGGNGDTDWKCLRSPSAVLIEGRSRKVSFSKWGCSWSGEKKYSETPSGRTKASASIGAIVANVQHM